MIELWSAAIAATGVGAAATWRVRLGSVRRELTTERLRNHHLETRIESIEARHSFEERLDSALAVPTSEPDLLSVALRALGELLPDGDVSFLLAHGGEPRVRFSIGLRSGRLAAPELVTGPDTCAALVTGRTAAVETNLALHACPHIADATPGFEASSLCVPLTVDDTTLGVLHALGPAGDLVDADTIARVEWLANRTAERLWRLRVQTPRDARLVSDPLTGLPTMAGLEKRVRELHADPTPFCLVHCDLDGFGAYNDAHGSEAGDRALQLFARVLTRTIRPGDLVARIGDDEFAVLLTDCHRPGAAAAMERVRERLVLTLTEDGFAPFTYSAGIAPSESTEPLEDLLDRAELAAETAFLQGGNRILTGDFDEPRLG